MAARLNVGLAPVALALVALALVTPWVSVAGPQALEDVSLEAGRRAYELSDYENAVKVLQDSAAKNPRNGEVRLLLAKSHFELRQFDAAIANATTAIDQQDRQIFGKRWVLEAVVHHDHGREFETAIRLNQKNYSAFQALIEFDCAAPGIVGGGEDKALAKIAQLTAMDQSEGHYAAGNCRRQKKDYSVAEMEFDKALVNAKSPDLIFDIGDYAMKRNQPERLLAVVAAGQKASPNDARTKFYRAAALILQRRNPGEAESLLREYLSTAPRRTGYPRPALAHDWLGRLFESQNNRDAAAREYAISLHADPKDKTAQDALRRLGKA